MLILIAIVFISVQIKTLVISSFVLTHDFIPLDSGWGEFAINIYEVFKV